MSSLLLNLLDGDGDTRKWFLRTAGQNRYKATAAVAHVDAKSLSVKLFTNCLEMGDLFKHIKKMTSCPQRIHNEDLSNIREYKICFYVNMWGERNQNRQRRNLLSAYFLPNPNSC